MLRMGRKGSEVPLGGKHRWRSRKRDINTKQKDEATGKEEKAVSKEDFLNPEKRWGGGVQYQKWQREEVKEELEEESKEKEIPHQDSFD